MKLFKALDEACAKKEDLCEVNLASITDFNWDKVVFVRMQATTTEFEEVTQIKAVDLPEFDDLVLFFSDGKEVFRDSRTYNPDQGYNKTYFLDFLGNKRHVEAFDREEAIFRLKKSEIGEYFNFQLQH